MATYTVATPKGGVGKSTTAAELVLALSQRRRRVLAIDLDQQGNLTNRYFMRNKDVVRLGGSEVDCSTLEKFECVLDGDKIVLEPIFIDEAECLQAQLEFERENRLHERLLGKIYENRVIEFDEEIVDDGKIWVRDVDTGERECVFFSDEVLDIRPQDIYKRPPNTGGYNISLEDGMDDAQISFR